MFIKMQLFYCKLIMAVLFLRTQATTELRLKIPGADGMTQVIVYLPSQGSGPYPGVVYLTDVLGIRPAFRRMAKRVAEQGYVVVLPNIYYRTDRLPIKGLSGANATQRAFQLMASLDFARMSADGKAYTKYLLSRSDVRKGKVGLVGYCLTGPMPLLTAATVPKLIGAAASFHGAQLVTDRDNSPHLQLPKVKAELYFAHAIKDQWITENQMEVLNKALTQWGGRFESEVYQALHAWTIPGMDSYDHQKAERAFRKLIALFERTL